jgi:hypothetical protein
MPNFAAGLTGSAAFFVYHNPTGRLDFAREGCHINPMRLIRLNIAAARTAHPRGSQRFLCVRASEAWGGLTLQTTKPGYSGKSFET